MSGESPTERRVRPSGDIEAENSVMPRTTSGGEQVRSYGLVMGGIARRDDTQKKRPSHRPQPSTLNVSFAVAALYSLMSAATSQLNPRVRLSVLDCGAPTVW